MAKNDKNSSGSSRTSSGGTVVSGGGGAGNGTYPNGEPHRDEIERAR